jgi:hypothetical protein
LENRFLTVAVRNEREPKPLAGESNGLHRRRGSGWSPVGWIPVPITVTVVVSGAGVAISIAIETMLPSFPLTELLSLMTFVPEPFAPLFAAPVAVVAIVVTVARGSYLRLYQRKCRSQYQCGYC